MCRRPVVGGSRSKTSQRSGCAGHDAQPFGTRRVSPHEDATEGFAKILYSRRHSRSHMNLNILFIRQCWVHTTALDIPADYDRWKHTDQHMYWSIAWHVSANKYTHCIMRSWANCHIVLIIMLIGPNVGHFKIFRHVFLYAKVRSWVLEEPATTWSQLWMAAFSSCLGRSPWICYQKGAWNCSTGRQLPKKSKELHAGGLQCLE
jgi:hypothetical protein